MSIEENIGKLVRSNNAMAQAMEGQAGAIENVLHKQEQRIVVKEQQVDKFLQEASPEIRYEQTIHIGGSKDFLYPVWWDFSGDGDGTKRITICRAFSWNGGDNERPLSPERSHQAGLLLEMEGNDVAWGGSAKFLEIKRFSETYNQTVSHIAHRMYSKAEKIDPLLSIYTGQTEGSLDKCCRSASGLYLRGGGLTYKIIKNWKGDVSFHDGSDQLRRNISESKSSDWSIRWYAEPIPFADILQPLQTTNAYIDPEG